MIIEDKEIFYQFHCPYCGSRRALLNIEENHDVKYLVTRGDDKVSDSWLKAGLQTGCSSKTAMLLCASCRHAWGTVTEALQEHVFAMKERSIKCEGFWYHHQPLPPHPRRSLVFPDRGKAVKCDHCGWLGVVVFPETHCPKCFREGTFLPQAKGLKSVPSVSAGAYTVIPDADRTGIRKRNKRKSTR